ncbi:MAG TPA: MFS transporter [Candidatus Saccharimonadales bacterium]|nr:MFS transporter [Candidatus Saccharimonadales bacterium]
MNPDLDDNLGTGRLKGAFGRTFQSLKHRNFRLYFIGQTISNTGNWLTTIALALLTLKITGSGLDVGLMAACQFGPLLFLSPLGGAIADRADKRRLLFVTQTLEMAQSFGLAALAFMPHPPLLGLYALALAGGTFLSLDNPLRRTLVNEMVPAKDVPNAIVLYSTIVNMSRLLGPALGGLLITTVGYGWAFTADGLSYSAVLLCLHLMNPSQLRREPPAPKAKGQVRAGLRYVRSTPALWVSFVMLAAIGTLSYNFNVTLPLYVTHSLHKSSGVFTVLYSLFSAGAVISALVIAHRNLVSIKHIVAGAAALGASMLLLGLAPNVIVAAPIAFLVGMAGILYTTATTTLAQVQAAPQMRGRVLALQTALLAGTTPIGGPILGVIADATSARIPIILGGLVCVAAAAFGYSAAGLSELKK